MFAFLFGIVESVVKSERLEEELQGIGERLSRSRHQMGEASLFFLLQVLY